MLAMPPGRSKGDRLVSLPTGARAAAHQIELAGWAGAEGGVGYWTTAVALAIACLGCDPGIETGASSSDAAGTLESDAAATQMEDLGARDASAAVDGPADASMVVDSFV